jgi:uncharacterized protein
MVQVSFPGVYVREVSSGVQTITGVPTSIAAFVGMARQGALNTPTSVLGFTDYERAFSSDTSLGEMTDQVRQFFQNGGTQAFIVRVASGASAAVGTLLGTTGTAVLTLTAISAGTDGAQLRASVDYNTANPERTFNLRVFREVLDASGNASIQSDELHKDLSMNVSDARFVEKVVANGSALVTAKVATATVPPIEDGVSVSAALAAGSDLVRTGLVNAAISAGKNQFRIRVGSLGPALVTIPATLPGTDDFSPIDTAIFQALQSFGATGTVTSTSAISAGSTGALFALQIAALGPDEVVIEAAPSASVDFARALGLGVAQGGIEIGPYAIQRPRPTGYVSLLGDGVANLLTFAAADRADLATLALSGSNGFTVSQTGTIPQINFPLSTGANQTVARGITAAGVDSLLNVRENLQAIAAGINNAQTSWRAEVHGYRLALLPRFGTSSSGTSHRFTGTNVVAANTSWNLDATGEIFDFAETTAQRAGEPILGGSDGGPPTLGDYLDAFKAIDQNVDLFNILVLPRTTAAPDFRVNVWGEASTFCADHRAFLIVDASTNATSVDKVLAEVSSLRIGVVKDHAALYWPPIQIPDGTGAVKAIDPSGSLAGIMARIDNTRGVWKAPAGLEADVRGIRGVQIQMSDAQNGLLNPQAINAVRSFPNGVVSWGARTMDGFDNSGNSDFKYIPVRRFELFLEESLVRGLKFAVFEPNDEPLWAQIRLAAGAFLNNLFRAGAFAGKTPRDAYFVKVDSETTTQNDINLGIVNVLVGFAPLKPAEFIIISIRQLAGQVQV